MHQGNWTCSGCGGAITELPFIPRSEAGLTCRTCYAKQKGTRPNAAPAEVFTAADDAPDFPYEDAMPATEAPPMDEYFAATGTTSAPTEKPKIAGNWQCANCGGAITSLPFTPRDTSNLKCLDCFKRSKA